MSNKTQLSNNNTKLASLIETLQGKASGGGSVETCTVTVTCGTNVAIVGYSAIVYQDGAISSLVKPYDANTLSQIVLENVVCNTVINVGISGASLVWELSGGVVALGSIIAGSVPTFQAPETAGAQGAVLIYTNV